MKGISFHPPTLRDVNWVRYPQQTRFDARTFAITRSRSKLIQALGVKTSIKGRARLEKTMEVPGRAEETGP
jgi:hypothetical protein